MNAASKIAILALIFFASGRLSAQGIEKTKLTAGKMPEKTLGAWKVLIEKKNKAAQNAAQAMLPGQKNPEYRSCLFLPPLQQTHSFFCDIEDFLSRKLRLPVDLGPE